MAAIDFPDNPTVGDQFTVGGQTWQWSGAVWEALIPGTFTASAHASTHESGGGDELSLSQSQIVNLTTDLDNKVDEVNGAVTTASTALNVVRNITVSTSSPTGGTDGDVWLVYST